MCVMWLAALAVPACGGSSSGSGSGSASCSGDTACGGDVVGTWKIQAACASSSTDGSGTIPNCAGASLSTSGLTVTGTFTFGADMTYSSSLVEGGSAHYTIPNSCLTENGQTVSCAELGAAFSSADTSGTFSSASCAASGSNCVCDLGTKPQTVTETGTYTVAGSALTMTASTGDVSTSSFCSKGNELHMAEMDMGMSVGTIVAAKQ